MLKGNFVMSISDDFLYRTCKSILGINLDLQPHESCLYFTDISSDRESPALRKRLVKARKIHSRMYDSFNTLKDEYPGLFGATYDSTAAHGKEPPESIWRLAFGDELVDWLNRKEYMWRLLEEAKINPNQWHEIKVKIRQYTKSIVSAVIAFSWFSTTHTRFRSLLTHVGTRYISMPMLDEDVLKGPIAAEWDVVRTRTEVVASFLDKSEKVHISCPSGSDIWINFDPYRKVHLDTGFFTKTASFGNLPAGEAYIAPKEDGAYGKLVLTSGPDHPNIEQTTAIVENGIVVDFEKETPYAKILMTHFGHEWNMRYVAEFGVGTNDCAHNAASVIEGEKICGTIHIALGDNSTFGGTVEAKGHLDHVIVSPTVYLYQKDGKKIKLIDRGKLVV